MEYDINLLKHQQDELLNRLNSLSVEKPHVPFDDAYSNIENAANKLSEIDRQELMKDAEYQKLVGQLNIYIQQEQFRLIRDNLNKNQDAVNLMKSISNYITKFKNDNDIRKAETLKSFEEYISKFSDMSYADYLKLKNTTKTE